MALAVLLMNATRAQADNIPFDASMQVSGGDSGCTDPPIVGTAFTFTANSNGGGCLVFHNFNPPGTDFTGLTITTAFTHPDEFFCNPDSLFLECGFSIDGGATILPSGSFIGGDPLAPPPTTLTTLFFGVNRDHPGIPGGGDGGGAGFIINLNSPCITTNRPAGPLAGPNADEPECDPNSDDGVGGWFTEGIPSTFAAVATTVPEPNVRIPLLLCLAAAGLVTRRRWKPGRIDG